MKQKLENILTKVQNPLTHKSVTEDKLLVSIHDTAGDKPVIEMRAAGDKKWQLAIEAQVRTHASKEGLAPDGFKFKWNDAKPDVAK